MSERILFLPVMQRVSRRLPTRLRAKSNDSAPGKVCSIPREAVHLPSERDFQAIFREAAIGIQLVDLHGRLVESNAAFQRLLGYSAEELRGMPWAQLIYPDDRGTDADLHRELLQGNRHDYQVELRYRPKRGQTVWVRLSVSLVHDPAGAPCYTLGMAEPISARKILEERLTHQAFYDALTDLPNRLLFHDRMGQALLGAQRAGTPFAVLLVDLDHFKEVNDTLGHRSGDLLLQQVAIRLQTRVRDADTVARFGGDEFIVLLPTADARAAAGGARRILSALTHPFLIDGHQRQIAASIGVSLYPEHGDDVWALLDRADEAMYAAKRSSCGYVLCESAAPRASATREIS